ncbi:MAG: haloacid dehalogenase-like hydrolase, partial [Deltaproteobacteria bacterium]|nr:haloacid dehalogenase-like hydrolase [Deltaproteobacteria bacterium]
LFALWLARRGHLTVGEMAFMAGWAARAALSRLSEREVAEAKLIQIRWRLRVGEPRADALYDEFFRAHIVPRLRQDVLAELERARSGTVVLITANLRNLLLRLGQELDIAPDRCLGPEAARDAEGRPTLALSGRVPMAGERARVVQAWAAKLGLDRSEVAAYGDSRHDIPMLEWAGHPVAVHPDRTLRRTALSRGWRVIDGV